VAQDRRGADGLSESRIGSVVSAMRGLYGYAIDREQVEFNPADAS
jgi:site-specific recombinase XerC